VHDPATQNSFAEQCTPQSPQFALSLAMFAQYGGFARQIFCPLAHELVHAPAVHTSPALHAFAQAPQLSRSMNVSTHELPHCVSPGVQLTAHVPCEQTCPAPHATSHAPQFSGSLYSAEHEP
jgi:hypothetical protein